ncbi:MAG: antitoxin [Verrucomicrobiae bacterium]|nr:antitoxin [Verrucomicrobiae bacterium]MCP5521987.1 antitoxin [Verrucomicrobiales bacterium]
MTRTQIQLPDDVYERARKVSRSREISFAELARRGLEYILSVYDPEPGELQDWELPRPRRLGWVGLSDADIKEQAQLTATEASLTRPRRR